MIISHNMMAMFAAGENKITGKRQSTSAEKLSSGYQINRAADDAAGLSISEEMRRQIRGLDRGADNINEGIDYCQVADGALNEIQDILQRMNELAIQAANGTNSPSDRAAIGNEIEQLKTETNRICKTTKYNDDYIFRIDDEDDSVSPYILSFSGYPDNIYIYNDSYDDATGEATYGGIAYNGTRYAWSSISAAMYDATTGLFNEGTYTLKTNDGTWLTFTCEAGAEPPKVSYEYQTSANSNGIYINGEQISWSNVLDESGEPLDKDFIKAETYHFTYHGVTISFTPEIDDEFSDVIQKISGTAWKSDFRLTYEDTALYGNFSDTKFQFETNAEVKSYIDGSPNITEQYVICASDGSNGTFDGVWLELNGSTVEASKVTWADLGITNWGDKSTDIWEDLTYTYQYKINDTAIVQFSFQLINETSKDSVIDALNGVELTPSTATSTLSHRELDTSSADSALLSAQISYDSLSLTLAEEYGLGRDYTQDSDTYAVSAISYKDGSISVTYQNTRDGDVTEKTYSNTTTATDTIVNQIKAQIEQNLDDYLDIIAVRYAAGASNPLSTNLTSIIGSSNLTGSGSNTYLEDVFSFDASDTNLITTLQSANGDYAGASIDFSGLGTSYFLTDLIGTGFNTTCQTCNNHYSIQFMTKDSVDTDWDSVEIDGNTYNYSKSVSGNNYTLYIDLDSMQGTINNGVDFTNAVVDILDAANYDFHYTQYATYEDNATLYVFDNRTYYAGDGASIATNADFQPYAYDTNMTTTFTVSLYDTDNAAESISITYEYDCSQLFDPTNLNFNVTENNTSGKYVLNSTTGLYELYDATNPDHTSATRYDINSVSLATANATLDEYLESYIRNTILSQSVSNTKLSLVSDYSGYYISADVNSNAAMVTEYDTPYQLLDPVRGKNQETGSLAIQCTAKTNDYICLKKQKLSLKTLGLSKLSVSTESKATKAISLIDYALDKVNTVRSRYGAYQNRLEHAYAINKNSAENTQASESAIRDTDMAEEMLEYSKNNILAQACQSVLAQANTITQGILTLLGT